MIFFKKQQTNVLILKSREPLRRNAIMFLIFSFLPLFSLCQDRNKLYLLSSDPKVPASGFNIYLGPSVSVDVFERDNQTGTFKTGIIPGIGYGLKLSKSDADATAGNYIVALDLFIQGSLQSPDNTTTGNYFLLDALPVLSVLNGWVGIGFGPRFKFGLNGNRDVIGSVLS